MQSTSLLDVKGLTIGPLQGPPLVEDLCFSMLESENLGLLGESGSGKSLTVMALLRLLPWPPLIIQKGDIRFAGRDVMKASANELQAMRGRELMAIFQDPLASLNPVRSLGAQIREMFTYHPTAGREQRIQDVLKSVGLTETKHLLKQYPHQISGGMRQRFVIAMAIALRPRLLIADEPSSALDVTLQAQLIELLRRLQREEGMSLLCVSHDLGVLAELSDTCMVLFRGRMIEKAPTLSLIAAPRHPYTRALVSSLPRAGTSLKPRAEAGTETGGCVYRSGCSFAIPRCQAEIPLWRPLQEQHWIACHRAEEIA